MTEIPGDIMKAAQGAIDRMPDLGSPMEPGEFWARVEYEVVSAILAERQRAWQPIETAPKDGTTILAFCQDGEGDDAEPMRQAVLKWDGNAGDSGLWVGYYRGLRYHGDPTHWQPLPPKPAAVSEGGEK